MDVSSGEDVIFLCSRLPLLLELQRCCVRWQFLLAPSVARSRVTMNLGNPRIEKMELPNGFDGEPRNWATCKRPKDSRIWAYVNCVNISFPLLRVVAIESFGSRREHPCHSSRDHRRQSLFFSICSIASVHDLGRPHNILRPAFSYGNCEQKRQE